MDDKAELEKQKLRAEIDEIKYKTKRLQDADENDNKRIVLSISKGSLKTFLKPIPIFVTVISAIFAIYMQSDRFFSQKAKEYEFNLNKTMIDLVKDLNGNNPDNREYAAILLSAYEKDSISILLWNLQRTKSPQATIQSLRLIKKKQKVDADEVLTPLFAAAKEVFDEAYHDPKVNIFAVRNYIMALGELGKENKDKSIQLFKELWTNMKEKRPPLSMAEDHILKTNLSDFCKKLKDEKFCQEMIQ